METFLVLNGSEVVAMVEDQERLILNIDFSGAKRGAVIKAEPGKTKISIRLSNAVLEYFRDQADTAGGGNYQMRIDEALLEHIHRRSVSRSYSRLARQRR